MLAAITLSAILPMMTGQKRIRTMAPAARPVNRRLNGRSLIPSFNSRLVQDLDLGIWFGRKGTVQRQISTPHRWTRPLSQGCVTPTKQSVPGTATTITLSNQVG
jgi:hypothetical protein